jgi:hypothetical protein
VHRKTPHNLSTEASESNENQNCSGDKASGISEISADAGIVGNCWTAPLAKLRAAHAEAMSVPASQAREVHVKFLNLWRSADAGIPTLRQAKADRSALRPRIERNTRCCGFERYFLRANLTATPSSSLRSPSSICPSRPRMRLRKPPHLPERPHSSDGESFFRGMTSGLAGPLP